MLCWHAVITAFFFDVIKGNKGVTNGSRRLNEAAEQGDAYDILIDSGGGQRTYVEVKTSRTDDK